MAGGCVGVEAVVVGHAGHARKRRRTLHGTRALIARLVQLRLLQLIVRELHDRGECEGALGKPAVVVLFAGLAVQYTLITLAHQELDPHSATTRGASSVSGSLWVSSCESGGYHLRTSAAVKLRKCLFVPSANRDARFGNDRAR